MKLTRKLIAINLALLLSFSLLPIQVLAAAIDLSLTPSVSFEEPNADGYTFTPTSTGFYTVTVSSTKHEGSSSITPASCGSLEVYQGTATDVAGFTHDGLNRSIYSYTIPMEANTTYTIIPHQGEGEHTSMSVVKADISALTVGTAARFSVSNAAASELDNYHWYAPRYYTFTPSQSGWYTFDLNSSGQTGYVGSISIYDNTFKRIEYNSAYVGNGVNVYLQGGQTYYLGFEPDEAGTYSIMASPSSFPVVTTTNSQSVVTDGPTVYATFTPETSGAYLISATSTDNWLYGLDVYSRTMEWLGGARRQDDSPILSVTVNMTGESTYYIGVDGSSTISAELAGSDLSGYCGKITSQYPQGENLTWNLFSDGTLTISGTGEMRDYDFRESPWYESRDKIKTAEIGDGTTSVGCFAFSECTGLTNVTIPDSVSTIAVGAFQVCTGLTSVTIPDGVTYIEDSAFSSCTGLTSIEIPSSVASIGQWAFTSCNALADVYYSGTKVQWDAILIKTDNDPLLNATIHFLGEDEVIASGYCGKITDRYPQGENLTWELTSDGTLTISGTGEMRDYDYVDIPVEGTDYSTPMPLTPWKDDLASIKKIVVENGATSIGDWAFAHCMKAADIVLPDGITSIGNSAFEDCDSLTSFALPDSVTEIDYSAFINCSKLSDITLSANLSRISTHLFAECKNLTSITIRQNVVSVQGNAFCYTDKLSDVYYSGTMAQWRKIDIAELGNESLLAATIHCIDGDINPKEDAMTLPEGVKFVPYQHSFGEAAEITAGRLPRGLSLDAATGELTGAPLESGSFEFTVRRANVSAVYQLTVQNNSNTAVQRPNDYDIIENVGTQDPYDPNSFYKEDYSEETFAINGPYEEFYRLLIDGREKIRDVDYTVREGSTIITVRAQTFQNVGEGTHTIAAEFRGKDSSGKDTMRQAAQNYTLTIRRPSENTGSGSSGGSGGSSSPTYSIKVPKIPNCTIKVSPTGASEGTRITLTVRPDTGYVLSDLTVTGPKDTKVALTQKDDFKYTFRMPDGKVSISAQVEREQPEPTPAGDTPFLDVKETDWFYHDVAAVYAKGWMVGTSKDTFSPSQQISRGMIVTVLHRIAGEPAAENTYFADVPLNRYYTAAAAWAVEQGIVTGYGDGHFGPSDPMTREQIIMILYNYANLNKLDTSAQSELSQFTDLDQLSSDARRAMSWAYSIGLIRGKGDGILDPAGATTRAETAAFLIRFVTLTED